MFQPIAQVVARIQDIEERIAGITGASPGSGPSSFAGALSGAAGADTQSPALDPDGDSVRPLGVSQYLPQIDSAAQKYAVDPALVKAVMQVESGGDPRAVSRAGAMGLMQLMPSDAAQAGVTDPFDPAQNIDAGVRQLSNLLGQFGGNLDFALAAYNAGPNAVKRFGGIPPYPETQGYVRKIRSILEGP